MQLIALVISVCRIYRGIIDPFHIIERGPSIMGRVNFNVLFKSSPTKRVRVSIVARFSLRRSPITQVLRAHRDPHKS